jgi:hypothetical protein
MLVTVIGYQLECCYDSSPKLLGIYSHTVRATKCYLMIKNTLTADAIIIMKLTLETTMMSGIQLILNAIL